MRRLIFVLVALQTGALCRVDRDPFAFFEPSVSLNAAERRALQRGAPVVTILQADDREIAVFSATALGPEVTRDRALAWMRQVEQLRRGRHVLATGRFSPQPRLEDLEGLSLDEEDLEDIRDCRPGDCGVKLSGREIARLEQVVMSSGAQWKAAVQAAFHELVLARVLAFSEGGHAALEDYCDRKASRSAASAFAQLLDHSRFLQRNLPDVARQLAVCAAAPLPGGERLVYWAKERLGSKAVITVTSVTVLQGDGVTLPDVFAVGVQIFASHYLDASLSVTAFVRDGRAGQTCFVYLHRSDVDVLDGFWRFVARAVIESRIKRDAPQILRAIAARLSAADPL